MCHPTLLQILMGSTATKTLLARQAVRLCMSLVVRLFVLPLKFYHVAFSVTICLARLCFYWHSSQSQFALQLYKVIKAKFLRSRCNAVFFCPFVVRIECCWIARFDFEWKDEAEIHILRSCQVCPAIPAKAMPPSGVLCKHLDDVLTYLGHQTVSA